MSIEEQEAALRRIAEIDAMFDSATGWGSWMVMCANEREGIVDRLRESGHNIGHKFQEYTAFSSARTN
tara:strand:- start:523 stop:726 length:204 start_codon:yes stop_codon:yes gene_type:complete